MPKKKPKKKPREWWLTQREARGEMMSADVWDSDPRTSRGWKMGWPKPIHVREVWDKLPNEPEGSKES